MSHESCKEGAVATGLCKCPQLMQQWSPRGKTSSLQPACPCKLRLSTTLLHCRTWVSTTPAPQASMYQNLPPGMHLPSPDPRSTSDYPACNAHPKTVMQQVQAVFDLCFTLAMMLKALHCQVAFSCCCTGAGDTRCCWLLVGRLTQPEQ